MEGCAEGHVVEGVVGTGPLEGEDFVKDVAQRRKECQGPSEVDDIALDRPALGKPRHGLVCHRVEDREGYVALRRPLVEQRLHITLGKDTAAAGNGVALRRALGQLIEVTALHIEQAGHLVDEGTGATGTGPVHPHLHLGSQKEDLGIFTTELDDHVG